MSKYIILNDCGAIVSGYNRVFNESIVTRSIPNAKLFDSIKDAQKFIDKCCYEDDFEIEPLEEFKKKFKSFAN